VLLGALALPSCGDDETAATSNDPSVNPDVDGDSISNVDEGIAANTNTDGDAFADYRDLDSDGDGLADAEEAGDADLATAPVDTDGDGTPDFQDLDSDGDGLDDSDELDSAFAPVDTDSDTIPDHLDTDSDGDTIADGIDGLEDFDGDGDPNFRDLDSDDDGIPDSIEAGDADEATSPVDTDGDSIPDFRDLDSDGDFVPDAQEDLNGNGVVDPGESSATSADTDADGTPDLIELIAGSDPNDATQTIPPGDFYFVLPYQGPGEEGPLDFTTDVTRADVFISMDTTGSFGDEIAAVQAALEQTIVPGIAAVVPDTAFGVGRFEDMPLDPFGLPGDKPFELLQAMTTDIPTVTAGLALLPPAAGGLDTPESGYEALYQWASGAGMPELGYAPFAPAGIGGVGFRDNALPIIVQITDAISHVPSDYAALLATPHTRDETVAALNAIGARVIGVDSLQNQGTADDPRAQLEDLAVATKALIPPDPTSGKCLTGVAGTPIDPVMVGGVAQCPVVFDVQPDGTGLATSIVDAVAQLATLGVLDISTATVGQTMGLLGEVISTGITTTDCIVSVPPVDPAPAGSTIDGLVFRSVTPGSTVNFQVEGFNDFQPATTVDQLFEADIEVLGDLVTLLDVRNVFIIVPKEIPDKPVPN
jgi:hypothetical protein